MRDEIHEIAEAGVRERIFPGCVVGVVTPRAEPLYVCAGSHTYEPRARPVRENSLYDLASITKSIPTASLALSLIDEGALSLDTEVRALIPDLRNDRGARVRDLLLYTVRGARLSELKHLSAEEMIAAILTRGFDAPPGERTYTNLPALILGLAIERAARTNLDILARKYFFDPLKMSDTAFFAGVPLLSAVPSEVEEWRGSVAGATHDESAYVLARSGRVAGHAGLFSTAPDLMAFMRRLIEPPDRLWSAIVEGAERGLGWQLDQPYFMGAFASKTTFGKTGFTGTSVLGDRKRGVALVILSNRTYPQRPEDNSAINDFRARIADIVLTSP